MYGPDERCYHDEITEVPRLSTVQDHLDSEPGSSYSLEHHTEEASTPIGLK
jgi:hypothetical protein